ncbi:hypothetical protein HN587_03850 [Candidatus Woesearchaeota archaeon]|nr:hypothetical protein [Candidatus Woesearchaeota archaeon]
MGLVGTDAPVAQEKVKSAVDFYANYGAMAEVFGLANRVASELELSLMNGARTPSVRTTHENGSQYLMSELRLPGATGSSKLTLTVGNPETGFFQVPIIQVAEGIDLMVTGTIGKKGKAERYETSKKLSETVKPEHNFEGAKRVYGIALVPKVEQMGDQVFVGFTYSGVHSGVASLLVNGFGVERGIISSFSEAPIMMEDSEGGERYLKLGDILSEDQVAKYEASGVVPGLGVTVYGFRKEAVRTPMLSLQSLGGSDLGGGHMKSFGGDLGATRSAGPSTGRLGLEIGDESDVKYQKARGTITRLESVLGLNLIGVGPGAEYEHVAAQVRALVPR